jgi:hypothetical protein
VKSVLERHLKTVNKSDELGSREVLYYFCNNRRRGTKERADSILRALLHQLVTRRPHILDAIFEGDPVLDSSSFQSDSWEWSTQRLCGIYSTAIRNSGWQELVMTIDALDECERDSVQIFLLLISNWKLLRSSGNRIGPMVKILLASRTEAYIEHCLEKDYTIRLSIIPETNKNDIEQ